MTDKRIEKDAVIIGGGISGLATAARLRRKGLNVLLLEKKQQPGGAIQTEQLDGFLVDCGPNSTLETSPEVREFVDEIGLSERRVYADLRANRRYILRDGELRALPMSPPQFLACNLFSVRAKLRLLLEPFIAPAPDDLEETIAQFVERRLGREFLDYAINPFIAGVYAGDPERLSVRSAVARIYALEKNYGSLIKGAIKGAKARKKRKEVDKTRARLFSFRDGMGELVGALKTVLAAEIRTSADIVKVELSPHPHAPHSVHFTESGARQTVSSRVLIFASPAFATAQLLEMFDRSLSEKLREIVYAPVAMVFFGYEKTIQCRALDGFGFLIPKVEKRRILGTIWSSTIFPHRAPPGGVALTTFVGGMRQPELPELEDAQLSEIVTQELGSIMQLQGAPDVIRIKRWPRAIPQYTVGHETRLQAVAAFERTYPGVFISGNFRSGISVGDCILHSREVAGQVSEWLKPPVAHGEQRHALAAR
ncbi:MAG: protoporphyrinogen oxidase [bacterium]